MKSCMYIDVLVIHLTIGYSSDNMVSNGVTNETNIKVVHIQLSERHGPVVKALDS